MKLSCDSFMVTDVRMLLTMLAAVAKMERDLLIERTKAGLEACPRRRKDAWQTP